MVWTSVIQSNKPSSQHECALNTTNISDASMRLNLFRKQWIWCSERKHPRMRHFRKTIEFWLLQAIACFRVGGINSTYQNSRSGVWFLKLAEKSRNYVARVALPRKIQYSKDNIQNILKILGWPLCCGVNVDCSFPGYKTSACNRQ
jgi:hypothetical protein